MFSSDCVSPSIESIVPRTMASQSLVQPVARHQLPAHIEPLLAVHGGRIRGENVVQPDGAAG